MRIEAYKEEKTSEVRVCESAVKQQLSLRPFLHYGWWRRHWERQVSHAAVITGPFSASFVLGYHPHSSSAMCNQRNL